MFLVKFSSELNNTIVVSAEQGSDFAKNISNDFNPIHDPLNKRFCVPGDLLFALAVERNGISEIMNFHFSGLVSADTPLIFPSKFSDKTTIVDERGKQYLEIEQIGPRIPNNKNVEQLTRAYVRFSGHNFPHILVPLMAEKGVMINPQRPLVIYQSMSLEFDRLNFAKPSLQLSHTNLDVEGKRGNADLHFEVFDGDQVIGHGVKHLILSGLRPYQQMAIDDMVTAYLESQSEHHKA